MPKNKTKSIIIGVVALVVVAVLVIVFIGSCGSKSDEAGKSNESVQAGQSDMTEAAAPENDEPIDLKLFFLQEKDGSMLKYLISKPFLLELLILMLIATIIKLLLVKRKLGLPWKFNALEKLSSTAFAATFVEIATFFSLIYYFQAATKWVFGDVTLMGGESKMAQMGSILLFSLHPIPFQLFIGAAITLIMLHLVTSEETETLKKYFPYSLLVASVTPVVFLLMNLIIAAIL